MTEKVEPTAASTLAPAHLGGDDIVAATAHLRDAGRPQRMTMIGACVATDELDAHARMTMLREGHRG